MSSFRVKNLENTSEHSTRWYSNRQEKAVAKTIGGKQTPNSGATPFLPGDVSVDDLLLVECKTKEKPVKSFSIKKEWLEKNLAESIARGTKYNVLAFNFGPDQKNYYVLDEALFAEFIDYIKELR